MITFAQLTRIADKDGVDSATVERDYVLTQVLAALYSAEGSSTLVFKGGTLLRACYFDDYRYSADLDFSAIDGDSGTAIATIASPLVECRDAAGFLTLELTSKDGQSHVVYQRPQGRLGRIKVNVSDDELVLNPVRLPLLDRYEDVCCAPDLLAYSLVEVASEKLRCIIQRLLARDLFDLHYLLARQLVDATASWQMFETKAEHIGLDPHDFWDHLGSKMPEYRQRWVDELSGYVKDPPEFGRVERETMRVLRRFR
ncbi:MAG: nucleotidyl transferase AbiEii/AbiGii toxin family protein [Actinomycetota bacterium]